MENPMPAVIEEVNDKAEVSFDNLDQPIGVKQRHQQPTKISSRLLRDNARFNRNN